MCCAMACSAVGWPVRESMLVRAAGWQAVPFRQRDDVPARPSRPPSGVHPFEPSVAEPTTCRSGRPGATGRSHPAAGARGLTVTRTPGLDTHGARPRLRILTEQQRRTSSGSPETLAAWPLDPGAMAPSRESRLTPRRSPAEMGCRAASVPRRFAPAVRVGLPSNRSLSEDFNGLGRNLERVHADVVAAPEVIHGSAART